VPHLRDGLIVAKVAHFRGSENPDTKLAHVARTNLIQSVESSFMNWAQKREPNSQNGNPSKINPEKWHVFRARKMTVNLPAFTSNPPQIHHQKPRSASRFCQNTQQKRVNQRQKKLLQKRPLFG
jgi:hypothetical protein